MTDETPRVYARPAPGETREEFTKRFIAALRAAGIPVKESDEDGREGPSEDA